MPTPLQRIALDKLKGAWKYHEAEDGFVWPQAECGTLAEPVVMSRVEAEALRGWFKEVGFNVGERLDRCDVVVEELGDVTRMTFVCNGNHEAPQIDTATSFKTEGFTGFHSSNPIADEHFPKPDGEVQGFNIEMKGDTFRMLQQRFAQDGWFREDTAQQGQVR